MSTKTNFKRVALVAVASLGLGVLTSVAPVSAATGKSDISQGTLPSTGVVVAIAGGSTAANAGMTATMVSTGRLSLNIALGTGVTNVVVSGGTFVGQTSGVASFSTNGLTATTASTTAIVDLAVVPNAGITTMIVKSYDGAVATASLQDTLTVNIVAAASVGAISVSDSPANLVGLAVPTIDSITDSEVTGIDTLGASIVRNGSVGQIVYLLRDSNLLALSSSGVVSVSSSNPAIAVSLDASFFSTSVAAANTNSYGSVYFAQTVANTPGTANVTLSYNGAAVWTKSVTIVGAVKSIVITAGDTTGKTGVAGAITAAGSAIDATAQTATADAGTFTFVTKDIAGNLVGGQTVSVDSSLYNASATSVALANSGATTKYSATAVLSGGTGLGETLGTWTCSTVAGDGKVGLSLTNALNESIKASISVKCAGSPSTYTASLDKASYVPGDIATLTITAKTSAATSPFTAATLGTVTTAELSIVGSQMTPVVAPTNSHTFGNTGAKTYKFIVGSTEGSYNMIVDLPKWSVASGYAGAAQTVAYKVTGGAGVQLADVLKAIVSLIASINKQIAALQKALLKK